jgi:hypothetical protein
LILSVVILSSFRRELLVSHHQHILVHLSTVCDSSLPLLHCCYRRHQRLSALSHLQSVVGISSFADPSSVAHGLAAYTVG